MNGRSIQDIVPPARSKPLRPPTAAQQPPSTPTPPPPPQPPRTPTEIHFPEKRGSMLIFVWIAIGAIAIAALVVALMSTVFHTAEATVTLTEWRSDVSGNYTAGNEELPYLVLTAEHTLQRTVDATGTTQAKDHASGVIVVSNLYSAQAQRLITNTRFQTPDSKIYRIHAPITVPGYTTKNGQKVAGAIEATVYADQPGESYNITSAEFKLPGLKGSNQYDLITARTKGPISGGFVGTRATVEKSVRDQAVSEMKAELDRELRGKITTLAGDGRTVFPDSLQVRFIESPDRGEGNQAVITVAGTAFAPGFETAALARVVAAHAAISSDAPLELKNPSEVALAYVEATTLESGGVITFTLSGTAHLSGVFSPLKFAADLAGKTAAEAEGVRANYPALIGPLNVSNYPFWLSRLPSNPERITVTVKGALD